MIIRQNRDRYSARDKSEIFNRSRREYWERKAAEEKRLREIYGDD